MGHDRNPPGLKVKVKTGRKATSYSLRVQTAVRQSGMKFTTTEYLYCAPYWKTEGTSQKIISLFPGIHRQTGTEMCSAGDEK